MPIMTGRSNLAANANSGNVLANLPFEFISSKVSRVAIDIITDVADVLFTFQAGGETLAQGTLIFISPGTNPDDVFKPALVIIGAPGERLFMEINNGGNVATIYWKVRIDPL